MQFVLPLNVRIKLAIGLLSFSRSNLRTISLRGMAHENRTATRHFHNSCCRQDMEN
jgi:hypothetical protein